jgi:hypothetical protein
MSLIIHHVVANCVAVYAGTHSHCMQALQAPRSSYVEAKDLKKIGKSAGPGRDLRSEARTQDRMMTSSCLPWKLSTVSIITCWYPRCSDTSAWGQMPAVAHLPGMACMPHHSVKGDLT